ncbi:hypothetical protein [uncultured Paraglaciecola sp.]|uniref:hypothetical protein n=1 Tax=uncultured Paraglaciecola sp. TaxID=1765024 RepID=UPI002633710C|nr:hypothetical protein [uncultured Paraglaciecola sp.]
MALGATISVWLAKKGLSKFWPVLKYGIPALIAVVLTSWAFIWHQGKVDAVHQTITDLRKELVTATDATRDAEAELARFELANAQAHLAGQEYYLEKVDEQKRILRWRSNRRAEADQKALRESQRESEALRINLVAAQDAIDGHVCTVPGALGRVWNNAMGLQRSSRAPGDHRHAPEVSEAPGAGLPTSGVDAATGRVDSSPGEGLPND